MEFISYKSNADWLQLDIGSSKQVDAWLILRIADRLFLHGTINWTTKPWAGSIQPKFPEISVQNSKDRFCPTGKISKKLVHPFKVDHFSRTDRSEFWPEWIAPMVSVVRCRLMPDSNYHVTSNRVSPKSNLVTHFLVTLLEKHENTSIYKPWIKIFTRTQNHLLG